MKAILAAGLVSVISFAMTPEAARAAGHQRGHHLSHHGGLHNHYGHGGIRWHGRGVSAGYSVQSYVPTTTLYAPETVYDSVPVDAPSSVSVYQTYSVPRVHLGHGHVGHGHYWGHGHHGGLGHRGHGHR